MRASLRREDDRRLRRAGEPDELAAADIDDGEARAVAAADVRITARELDIAGFLAREQLVSERSVEAEPAQRTVAVHEQRRAGLRHERRARVEGAARSRRDVDQADA